MQRWRWLVTLAVVLSYPVAADFDAGLEAFQAEDYDTALTEWQASAEGGDPRAQFHLGNMFASGTGVRRSLATAFGWYEKSAEAGFGEGQAALAFAFRFGNGVGQNYELAAKWYRRAANQGIPDAMYNAGGLYATGDGVEQNWAEAYKWLMLAAAYGMEPARDATFHCEPHLSDEQIIKAQDTAAEWRPKLEWP
jgi:TPR repeat protein